MKRALGFLLILLGVVATAAGSVVGCRSVFGGQGRRAIEVFDLTVDQPLHVTFAAERGARYAAGVQVVFAREGLREHEGRVVVTAHMPLVATFRDAAGDRVAETVGWLDPDEPPTVLLGHLDARPAGGAAAEVVAERFVGPFPCPRDETMSLDVDLRSHRGPEGASRIAKTRVVLYDDALGASAVVAFGVAGAGLVASLCGMVVLMAGFFRKKRGIRPRAMSSSMPKILSSAVLAVAVALAYAPPALAQQTPPKSSDAKKKDADKKATDKDKGKDKDKDKDKDKKAAEEPKPEETKKVEAEPRDEPAKEAKRAVYIDAEGGLLRSDLGGISDSLSLDRTGANGLSYGFGGGVRFDEIRLGAKFHGFSTTEYEFWSVMAEFGYGLHMRPFEPVFFFHGGYMWSIAVEQAAIASSLPPGTLLPPAVDMNAGVLGIEALGAYWVNPVVHVGPFVGADLAFLHRSQSDLPRSALPGGIPDDIRAKPLYNESGTGIGYVINLGLRGTLDLGF